MLSHLPAHHSCTMRLHVSLTAVCALLGRLALAEIVNKDVVRVIDGSSAIVKTSIDIRAEGVEGTYTLVFSNAHASHLAFLSVTSQGQELVVSPPRMYARIIARSLARVLIGCRDSLFTHYDIAVSETAPALKVQAVFTDIFEPFPAEITQSDNQLVKYSDNHSFLSPYRTENQRTAYTLASTLIESYTKRPPSAVRGSSVVFGPYKDVPPFEISPMLIHSVNNKPFSKFTSMIKEIEVSHWGMISVEEVYELKNTGATLKGGFSRFDYQNKRYGESPSFRGLKAVLPAESTNIYYRDQIGNISTSDLRFKTDSVEMDVLTRFPMFGGWQTQFYIGYSIPTENALSIDADSNRYSLKMDFFSSFLDVWVEDLELKVVLPEGCTDIRVNVPYEVEQSWTTRFTYLDSALNGGRPVLKLKARNLVPQHSKQIVVSYNFSRSRMLVEPLMLIGSVFCLFLLCSIFARLDEKVAVKGSVKQA